MRFSDDDLRIIKAKRSKRAEVRRRQQLAANLYREGWRVAEICEKFGIAQSTARRYLDVQGVELDRGRRRRGYERERRLARERADQSAKLWRDGLGVDEIADLLGVVRSTIQLDIKSKGFKLDRSRSKRTHEVASRRREVAKLYEIEGHSVDEIAEMQGISLSTVKVDLNKMGVRIQRKGRPTIASDPAQMERIRKLHQEHGWTCMEIGWMLGVGGAAIQRRLNKIGVSCVGRRGKHINDQLLRRRERAKYFYDKGEPLAFIAYNLGIGYTTLLTDLKIMKVKYRSRYDHPWNRRTRDEVRGVLERRAARIARFHQKLSRQVETKK